jgi:hypothetical protein
MDISFFKNNNFQIYDDKISVSDLIKKTKNSKISANIIGFTNNKTYYYDDNGYVDMKTAFKILNQFKNKTTEKLLKNVNIDVDSFNEQNNNIGNKFYYNNNIFTYFILDEKEDDNNETKQNIYFNVTDTNFYMFLYENI